MTVSPRPYEPPTVTVSPPEVWSTPQHTNGTWLLRFVLDTRNGQFTARPTTWSEPHRTADQPFYDPGEDLWVAGKSEPWHRTPALLGWDMWHPNWPPELDNITDLLLKLELAANVLLAELLPVPDTFGEWEWSPGATAAYERIKLAVYFGSNKPWIDDPLPERAERVVSLSEVLDTAPDVLDTVIKDAEAAEGIIDWPGDRHGDRLSVQEHTDADLDRLAALLTGPPTYHLPAEVLKRLYGRYFPDVRTTIYQQPHIVGARTGLREERNRLLTARTGLPVRQAAAYWGGDDPAGLIPELDDGDMDDLIHRLVNDAAREHRVALIGTADYLYDRRAIARERVRDALHDAGDNVRQAEQVLAAARASRASLVGRILSWRAEPEVHPDGTVDYAEVGRLAGMTRQGARQLCEALTAGPDDTEGGE